MWRQTLYKCTTNINSLTLSIRFRHADPGRYTDPDGYYRERIGNRETVGYGRNGQPEYMDDVGFPFPSIRYKPPTPEIQALRQKEKGDWRLLTIKEKKSIYRASFCQTFAEFNAPTGEWMYTVGISLMFVSLGIWFYIFCKIFVLGELPKSFEEQSQKAQLRRMLRLRVNPITGLSSNWDYDKKKWISKPWNIPFEDPFEDGEDDYE